MRIIKAGALYFAVVFGAGFLLGIIRTLWLTPLLGARTAELLEAPIMLLISIISAWWLVRYFSLATSTTSRLGMGILALALLLVAELVLVLPLRGLSTREYFAARDPVAAIVYYLMLLVFAVLPLLMRGK